MKIETFLEDHFASRGWTWSLKGRGDVQPTEDDFRLALDEARKILYAEDSETGSNMMQLGRLIIIKHPSGLDVYVLADTIPLGE
jgi:hypothetical protein